MAQKGIILASSSAIGVFNGSSISWAGGRAALVTVASQYGALVQLAIQYIDGTWVPINTTTISANGCVGYDVPPGQVRIQSTGSSAGLSASLVGVPYL